MPQYYIEKLNFQDSKAIEKEFNILLNYSIDSVTDLEAWLTAQTKLYEALDEALNGHYIDFQSYNTSQEAKQAFEFDQQTIQPLYKKYQALLDQKYMESPYRHQLDEHYYEQLNKSKKNAMDLFRESNIELEVEEDRLATNYFEHTGSLTVDWEGEDITLSQLYKHFQDSDRKKRKEAVTRFYEAFASKKDELNTIMNELIQLRQEKAENADLANYRDYMFKKYERFDYTPENCKELAEAVREYVVPLKEQLDQKHQKTLGLKDYRPWDTHALPVGKKPLKPYTNTEELINGTSSILKALDSRFGDLIETMNERHMLDLENRKGKSPGGFCESLPLSKLSFIFMNAAQRQEDVVTLLHEMGHCIHNDLTKDLPLYKYKDTPMESAELASMTMELITMDYWNIFYKDEEDLKRAKREELEGIIKFLPSGIIIDQFQHWLYENPNHTIEERSDKYKEISKRYDSTWVDWTGYEDWLENKWLPVLHIFEVPFYYIEYVIAQLGAVQMYKQYKENPEEALENYKKALSLGSSKSLTEVYEAAGIHFDFSAHMIKELMEFISNELKELE